MQHSTAGTVRRSTSTLQSDPEEDKLYMIFQPPLATAHGIQTNQKIMGSIPAGIPAPFVEHVFPSHFVDFSNWITNSKEWVPTRKGNHERAYDPRPTPEQTPL